MKELFELLGLVIPPRLALAIGGVCSILAGVLCLGASRKVEGLLWRGPLLLAGGAALVWVAAGGLRRTRSRGG
jgi:hypothetical protein